MTHRPGDPTNRAVGRRWWAPRASRSETLRHSVFLLQKRLPRSAYRGGLGPAHEKNLKRAMVGGAKIYRSTTPPSPTPGLGFARPEKKTKNPLLRKKREEKSLSSETSPPTSRHVEHPGSGSNIESATKQRPQTTSAQTPLTSGMLQPFGLHIPAGRG